MGENDKEVIWCGKIDRKKEAKIEEVSEREKGGEENTRKRKLRDYTRQCDEREWDRRKVMNKRKYKWRDDECGKG